MDENKYTVAAIEALLIAKKARLEKATQFILNRDMDVERQLLKHEIEALEAALAEHGK